MDRVDYFFSSRLFTAIKVYMLISIIISLAFISFNGLKSFNSSVNLLPIMIAILFSQLFYSTKLFFYDNESLSYPGYLLSFLVVFSIIYVFVFFTGREAEDRLKMIDSNKLIINFIITAFFITVIILPIFYPIDIF